MTESELRKVADEMGFFLQPKRERKVATYKKCKDCKWLTGKRSCIGVVCENPNKKWMTDTAKFKYPCNKACKAFEEVEHET